MKRILRWALAAVLCAIVVALVVVLSGVVPIKASSGHWGVTSWLLRLAKERSVATHSILLELPPLDDPALVLKGAAHFDTGCGPCHGDPTRRPPVVPQGMLPPPPRLSDRVTMYSDEELFSFVKHGIKFTGMPAWPTQQRDDEVRAIVAFLRVLPTMDAARYVHLARGDDDHLELDAPTLVKTSCARCHGAAGHGRGAGAFPKLAGQSEAYLDLQLRAYARGTRPSGIMQPIAAALGDDDVRALAAWYARRATAHAHAPGREASPDLAAVARGRALAQGGVPARRIASCVDCHGPAATPRNPAYPTLAGQYAAYLVLQLQLFAAGRRGGSELAGIMHASAHALAPAEIEDVAAFYAALDPAASLP